MTPAIFGISNGPANLVASLLVLSLVAIWLSLIYWTYEDARRRIEDPMLVWIFTAWSLFPFIGTLIYLIIRPPEYLEDVREREIETNAAEARLHMLKNRTCSNCGYEIESSYLRCPSCLRKLKEPCKSCDKPLDPRWRVCPFCETEVKRARPAAAGARRSRGRGSRRRRARGIRGGRGQRSSAAERAAERSARRSAAERQKRSLASVSSDWSESNGPASKAKPSKSSDEAEQRLSAAAAIGPKRGADGAESTRRAEAGGRGRGGRSAGEVAFGRPQLGASPASRASRSQPEYPTGR